MQPVPVDHVLIGWCVDDDHLIERVTVLDARDVQRDVAGEAAREWAACTHTSGVCLRDWATKIGPVAQFALLAIEGFASLPEARGALEEFSQIEGCEWAATAFRLTQ